MTILTTAIPPAQRPRGRARSLGDFAARISVGLPPAAVFRRRRHLRHRLEVEFLRIDGSGAAQVRLGERHARQRNPRRDADVVDHVVDIARQNGADASAP